MKPPDIPTIAKTSSKTISIIVPVLNEAANISTHLQRYRQMRSEGLEVIFVDGGSSDGGVVELERQHFTVLKSASGRARQMNAGARAARGEILLFLHADTCLPKDFPQCLASFNGRWGFFLLRLSNTKCIFRWVEQGICLRSKVLGVGTGDQCLFFDRRAFELENGFADIALMEDIEIARRFKRFEPAHIVLSPVTASARRWERHGVLKTVIFMWWLQILYCLGVSPETLHKKYYGA